MTTIAKIRFIFKTNIFNPIWTGLLRGSSGQGGGGSDSAARQYLGLHLSVVNKTWQIYKTNQNKVIDLKKLC